MQLKEFMYYPLFIVQVHLIQTPSKNVSIFIEPRVSDLECLKAIISETFRFKQRTLISLTVSGIDEEIDDLQKMVVRYLNEKGNATLHLLDELPRPEFQSSIICYKESSGDKVQTCRKNFVLKESTNFYVIIASGFLDLKKRVYSVCNSTTFNPFAEFVIYWRPSGEDHLSDLHQTLWECQMWKVIVADHDIQNNLISVRILQPKLLGPGMCMDKIRFSSVGRCQSSNFFNRIRSLINMRRTRESKIFKNCTIGIIAMKYEPFVISNNEGLEIRLIEEMGKRINVTFDIQLSMAYADWGNKVNGSWDGNFRKIINTLKVGIGNVGPEADRLEDFDFTERYKSTKLVWVVPIAKNVQKWRVITIIFTPELWIIIFTVLVLISGLFMTFSRSCGDNAYLQSFSGSLLASLQILIGSSVYNAPKVDLVRLVFGGGLLFALIVTCVYCSYLINVLTNVVKEHQIQNVKDILESNLIIGGLEEYLERYKTPDTDECLDEICRRYQFYQDDNDTAKIWLKKVEERVACTPLNKMFVQYYMVKTFERSERKTEGDRIRRVKLFIINKPINSYSLAMVLSKGNPFRFSFNRFIKQFIEAGLMYTLSVKHNDDYRKLQYLESYSDEGPEKLSIYHVQAPFAILGIGSGIATLILLVEKLWCLKYFMVLRRKTCSTVVARSNPRFRSLYYDRLYGNMYGKNYPSKFERKYLNDVKH